MLIWTRMRSIEWHYFQWPWVTPNYPKPPSTVWKQLNRSSFVLAQMLPLTYPTQCWEGMRVSLKIRLLLSRTFTQTLDLENYTTGDGRRSPIYHTYCPHLYSTVGIRHGVVWVCQWQRRLVYMYMYNWAIHCVLINAAAYWRFSTYLLLLIMAPVGWQPPIGWFFY